MTTAPDDTLPQGWLIDGRPVVITGEWSEGDEHGYTYTRPGEKGEWWIRSGNVRITCPDD